MLFLFFFLFSCVSTTIKSRRLCLSSRQALTKVTFFLKKSDRVSLCVPCQKAVDRPPKKKEEIFEFSYHRFYFFFDRHKTKGAPDNHWAIVLVTLGGHMAGHCLSRLGHLYRNRHHRPKCHHHDYFFFCRGINGDAQ
nr:hypothetical protein [Pandoravirus aubagnensis]